MQTSRCDDGRELVEENARLNDREFAERKTVLESYPRTLFVQMNAPCNQDCVFCSRPESYRWFDLEDFRRKFEDVLAPAFARAQSINLTGSGELLQLPEAKRNLDYFNRFPHAEKMFATNGSSLTPKMIDYIAQSGNRYTVHVSLHGSNAGYHALMTNGLNYDIVMYNLEHIRRMKRFMPNVVINFIFVATARNIRNLVDFIKFAHAYGADGVVVYYNFVYRMDQRKLSCWFCQEQTNEMIDLARAYAGKLAAESGRRMNLVLPHRFGQDLPPGGAVCGEAWSQLMINPDGDVISCDAAGDSRENIAGRSFDDVWNGDYFRELRRLLASGRNACSEYCIRGNPAAVNHLRSHIITRGKTEQDIQRFLEGL